MPLTKVTSGVIAANAVVDSFGTQSITGDKIGLTAINANNIVNNTITGNKIALGTITGDDIAVNQITGNLLTANCVSGNNIVSGVSLTGNVSITGNVVVGAGTVSNAAISTTGDPNTGVFFPAADTIAFTEGGTEAMRLNSSGFVGIDNTTPDTRFVVGGVSAAANTNWVQFRTNVGGTNPPTTNPFGLFFGCNRSNGSSEGNIAYRDFLTFASWNGSTYAESMRVTSGGDVLVNTTSSTAHKMTVQSAAGAGAIDCVGGSTNGYYALRVDMPSTNTYGVLFRNNSNNVGDIRVNSSSTAYNTSSDYRLKENIAPMTGALFKVTQLKPCTYTWKLTGETGEGFIAHELQAIVPDAVTGEKDAVDAKGNPIYQGIDTSFLVATLTAAIQELKAELDAAKQRITELENANK